MTSTKLTTKLTTKLAIRGWKIVGYCALAIAIAIALILLIYGINEPSLRMVVRATARTSWVLFLAAFTAFSLRQIHANSLTRWMVDNYRYLVIAMAVSYGFHALAIAKLAIAIGDANFLYDPGGLLGYLFILAMMVTSFDRFSSWFDRRVVKVLHVVGMYYLWIAFTYTFINRLGVSMLFYLPFVIVLGLALLIRAIALLGWRNSRLT
ncbi:hypothetical protein IQ235_13720 [Oscillatoriales cyanobacterium LEGE 11467]|uniref:Ferric oxidoreductase domain-containing protein n=1 Tax=Zarconia navalis LEGE 11467 TaxID=1828826 RepID=A0A928VWZ5_9CYAN|nr:hypothetical protein [Zarconia navalis]MBE9041839.1 hypothetical protein [Zarconia navalis LEGE 11467]